MYKKPLNNLNLFHLFLSALTALTDPKEVVRAVKALTSIFIDSDTEMVFSEDKPFVLLSEVFAALHRFEVVASYPLIEAITKAVNSDLVESYSIIFSNTPAKKIPVIKWLREHSNLGLREAKELVEKGYCLDDSGYRSGAWNGLEWSVLSGNKNKIDRAAEELKNLGFYGYYISNTGF